MIKVIAGLLLVVNFSFIPAANHYVRSGASGNGSDWTNAYGSLPATLVRGDTYYVADGTYGGYKFDDPLNGTKYITIKKAIQGDHGTEIGWQSGYGDGYAGFSPTLTFVWGYYKFDGQVGGGPGSWTSGHGFRLTTTGDPSYHILIGNKGGGPSSRYDIDNVEIRHVEVAGNTPLVAASEIGIDATGSGIQVTNLTISHCYVHDISQVALRLANIDTYLGEYNYLARNRSSSSFHGQGHRFDRASNVVWRYNRHVDFTGTGFMGFYGGPFTNIEIYGCIFWRTPSFTSGVGNGVITSTGSDSPSITNFKAYNNTFVNHAKGNCITFHGTGTFTNMLAYNNLFYDLGTAPTFGGVTDHDYSWFGMPSSTFNEANAQVGGNTDPFVDWQNENFTLKQATQAGKTLAAPFNKDMFGNVRGADGVWDRGAIEYSTTNIERRTPNADFRSPHIPAQINDLRLQINDGRVLNLLGQIVKPGGVSKTGIYFLLLNGNHARKITFISR